MAEVKATFVKERETKGTIRFAEQAEHEDEPVIGTLYVPKRTLREIDNADGSKPLTVVVTVAS